MEVNKVSSWEDVLANNFSAEQQAQEQEKQEVVSEETVDSSTENTELISSDDNAENAKTQSEETETLADTTFAQEVDENHSDYDESQSEEVYIEQPSLEDLDEDSLYELLTLKKTDFTEVPDIDIVAGYLYDEHPNWEDDDIRFELEQKYGSALFEEKVDLEDFDKDLDPEGYKEAVKFNKEIDRAQKLLRRDALEMRTELEAMQSNIQLPTAKVNKPEADNVNAEADNQSVQQLTAEEVERLQKQWIESVEREVPSVDEFKFTLGDEEVSYKVTDEEKQDLVEKMKSFNAETYLVDRGWINQDGTPNVKKITEDVYILENSEKMFKSGWTQAKEKAKMDIIGKDIKNIDFSSKGETFDAKASDPHAFGNYVLGFKSGYPNLRVEHCGTSCLQRVHRQIPVRSLCNDERVSW